jgi:drug/metabolite transporter (DMT)-like permease
MEQARLPRKTWTVAGGACWGGITALAITLLNWYNAQHIETLRRVIGRFAIFILLGILVSFLPVGPIFQNRKPTRTQTIALFVLFICLMLGLAYLLWTMVRH